MLDIIDNINTKQFVGLMMAFQFLFFILALIISRWAFSRKISHQLEEIRAYLMGLGKDFDSLAKKK